jgi:hypothetical protein
MSGHDFLVEIYVHRELRCAECKNALVSDGEVTERGKEILEIQSCTFCLEKAEREGFERGTFEAQTVHKTATNS